MADPTNDEILNLLYCIAPQFANPSDDELACYNTIITALWCQVNAGAFQCCVTLAFVYLLAHVLTLRSNPSLGVTSSMSEGSLSIGFTISNDSGYLSLTQYGKSYQNMINIKVFPAFNTNLPANFTLNGYNGRCC